MKGVSVVVVHPRDHFRSVKTIRDLALTLLASSLLFSCTSKTGDPDTHQANTSRAGSTQNAAVDADVMFIVETASLSGVPITVGKYRIEAKQGNTLFVATIQFTERANSLPMDEFKQLKISELAKTMSEILGRLVGTGDLQYRMPDGALLPCSVLPLTEQEPSPPLSITSPEGRADWLMYIGRLRAVGSVPSGETPASLIWGGKYEVPIHASSK